MPGGGLWRPGTLVPAVALVALGGLLPAAPGSRAAGRVEHRLGRSETTGRVVTLRGTAAAKRVSHCPWASASALRHKHAKQLALELVDRMTLSEKLGFLVLNPRAGYENINQGVRTLCLPALTLQDGPNGVSAHATGVTQLPASLGIAASFAPSLAYRYGQVEGAEARGKGIDVVQGPNLNLDRVPESGREFEGYGEDPFLVSEMGVADIRGIQSEKVMADAKHFTAYNQETARLILNEAVPARALEELYLAPFAAAVKQGHVASIMCAYGSIDGVNDCSDPKLYRALRSWDFSGFVRSDLAAVVSPAAAFNAGLDLIKPATVRALRSLVRRHKIAVATIDEAVLRTLTEMFRFGLIAHPRRETPLAVVRTSAHAAFAVRAAERSMVLLRDQRQILPLSPSLRSVALIGADASTRAMSAGGGSAYVVPPYVIAPLGAIRQMLGKRARVLYASGEPSSHLLPPIPAADIVSGSPLPAETPQSHRGEPGTSDLSVEAAASVTRAAATAALPGRGGDWSSWKATVVAPRSGLYEISLEQNGDTWLYLDGRQLLSFPGLHGRFASSTTVELVKGRHYRLRVAWFAIDGAHNPRLGWQDVTPLIRAAAATARRAKVAVVFVNDFTSEGVDRPSLALPGDQNALVVAVAKANPRTVVVLNTGGAVLMPWLDRVRGVLEAWYPGQGDGTATAAVLFGKVDPGGRLPVTFPASETASAVASPRAFPGVDSTVHYGEGLDIGYRYFQAHHVSSLFPFGFGLTYTSFALSPPVLGSGSSGDTVALRVTNTGRRRGTEVVQAYLGYPPAAGEPPRQLRAFDAVTLAPGASVRVVLDLPRSAFVAFLHGRFSTVSGSYTLFVGTSSTQLAYRLTLPAP